jgi:hypothetical protein
LARSHQRDSALAELGRIGTGHEMSLSVGPISTAEPETIPGAGHDVNRTRGRPERPTASELSTYGDPWRQRARYRRPEGSERSRCLVDIPAPADISGGPRIRRLVMSAPSSRTVVLACLCEGYRRAAGRRGGLAVVLR